MDASDDLLLGLDLGTTRVKALLLRGDGRVHKVAAVPTPVRTRPGRVEIATADLVAAAREATALLGPDRSRVVAVGLAGMAESGAAFDARRRPLSPVIVWSDPRGQEVVDGLRAAFGEDLDRAIGQRLRTICTVAKLGWLSGDPDRPAVACWMGVPEVVLHALSGLAATEHSLAARTGCYEVGRMRWMPDVARAAGFPASVFPPVLAAGSAMGRTTRAASRSWELPEGIPVTIAGHDHLAGMIGAGVEPPAAANSVGTAETVVARLSRPPDPDRALGQRVAVTVFPGGDGWALLSGAARAGVVVETAAAVLGRSPSDLDDLAARPGLDPWDTDVRWDALVDELAAGHRRALAALAGLDAGLDAGRDAGLDAGLDAGTIWAGLLEALCRRAADAVARLAAVNGWPARLVAFGGGARSETWMGLRAAAVWLPVWQSEAHDAAARGAAVMAGVAAAWWEGPSAAPPPPARPVAPQALARTRSETTRDDPPGGMVTP